MPTLEERVAFLEGKVEEHASRADGIREALVHLEGRMDSRFAGVGRRFESLETRFTSLEEKMDRRFEAVDRRFETVDSRFAGLDLKLDAHFVTIDAKLGRLTGVVVTALAAVLAAVGGIVTALLR